MSSGLGVGEVTGRREASFAGTPNVDRRTLTGATSEESGASERKRVTRSTLDPADVASRPGAPAPSGANGMIGARLGPDGPRGFRGSHDRGPTSLSPRSPRTGPDRGDDGLNRPAPIAVGTAEPASRRPSRTVVALVACADPDLVVRNRCPIAVSASVVPGLQHEVAVRRSTSVRSLGCGGGCGSARSMPKPSSPAHRIETWPAAGRRRHDTTATPGPASERIRPLRLSEAGRRRWVLTPAPGGTTPQRGQPDRVGERRSRVASSTVSLSPSSLSAVGCGVSAARATPSM